jgi:transcriptional regulator with XRE-family HTH domain
MSNPIVIIATDEFSFQDNDEFYASLANKCEIMHFDSALSLLDALSRFSPSLLKNISCIYIDEDIPRVSFDEFDRGNKSKRYSDLLQVGNSNGDTSNHAVIHYLNNALGKIFFEHAMNPPIIVGSKNQLQSHVKHLPTNAGNSISEPPLQQTIRRLLDMSGVSDEELAYQSSIHSSILHAFFSEKITLPPDDIQLLLNVADVPPEKHKSILEKAATEFEQQEKSFPLRGIVAALKPKSTIGELITSAIDKKVITYDELYKNSEYSYSDFKKMDLHRPVDARIRNRILNAIAVNDPISREVLSKFFSNQVIREPLSKIIDDVHSKGGCLADVVVAMQSKWEESNLGLANLVNEQCSLKGREPTPPVADVLIENWKQHQHKGYVSVRAVEMFCTAFDVEMPQRIKLWQIINGKKSDKLESLVKDFEHTQKDKQNEIRASIVRELHVSSGIPDPLLSNWCKVPETSIRTNWMTRGYAVRDIDSVKRFVAFTAPNFSNDKNASALQEKLVSIVTGKPLNKSISEIYTETKDSDKPIYNFFTQAQKASGKNTVEFAESLGLSKKQFNDLKYGLFTLNEAQSKKIIDELGLLNADKKQSLLTFFTGIEAPDNLLGKATAGEITSGEMLRLIRERKGLELRDVTSAIGLSYPGLLSRAENNLSAFHSHNARKLGEYYGFEKNELLGFAALVSGKGPRVNPATLRKQMEDGETTQTSALATMVTTSGYSHVEIAKMVSTNLCTIHHDAIRGWIKSGRIPNPDAAKKVADLMHLNGDTGWFVKTFCPVAGKKDSQSPPRI